jgi:hypothetical protein
MEKLTPPCVEHFPIETQLAMLAPLLVDCSTSGGVTTRKITNQRRLNVGYPLDYNYLEVIIKVGYDIHYTSLQSWWVVKYMNTRKDRAAFLHYYGKTPWLITPHIFVGKKSKPNIIYFTIGSHFSMPIYFGCKWRGSEHRHACDHAILVGCTGHLIRFNLSSLSARNKHLGEL